MPLILIEHTTPSLPTDQRDAVNSKLPGCLFARNARWLRSYVSQEGSSICQFDAPDAESVRQAYRTAGATIVRTWVVSQLNVAPNETAPSA
jgi:hypothetical protein